MKPRVQFQSFKEEAPAVWSVVWRRAGKVCSLVYQPGEHTLYLFDPARLTLIINEGGWSTMEPKFGQRILECVDKALDVMGQCPKQVVYTYLEHARNLKREEIPVDQTGFILALESLFGAGAKIFERMIIREVESAFGVHLHSDRLSEVMLGVQNGAGRQDSSMTLSSPGRTGDSSSTGSPSRLESETLPVLCISFGQAEFAFLGGFTR